MQLLKSSIDQCLKPDYPVVTFIAYVTVSISFTRTKIPYKTHKRPALQFTGKKKGEKLGLDLKAPKNANRVVQYRE